MSGNPLATLDWRKREKKIRKLLEIVSSPRTPPFQPEFFSKRICVHPRAVKLIKSTRGEKDSSIKHSGLIFYYRDER